MSYKSEFWILGKTFCLSVFKLSCSIYCIISWHNCFCLMKLYSLCWHMFCIILSTKTCSVSFSLPTPVLFLYHSLCQQCSCPCLFNIRMKHHANRLYLINQLNLWCFGSLPKLKVQGLYCVYLAFSYFFPFIDTW